MALKKMGTVVLDKGFKKAIADMESFFKGNEIVVGLFGEAADEQRGDAKNPITMLQIASSHEFGDPERHIPQRSFLRTAFDQGKQRIIAAVVKAAEMVSHGKLSAEQAHNQLGLLGQKMVDEKIASNIPPPNAPRTIKKKGSSKTLIDTGRMRQSMRYEIREIK